MEGKRGEEREEEERKVRVEYRIEHRAEKVSSEYLNFGIITKKLTFITLFVPELEQELYLKKMQKCTFAKNWQNFDLNQELLPRK